MIVEINVIPAVKCDGTRPSVSHSFQSTGKIIIALVIVKELSLTAREELVLTYWEPTGMLTCSLLSS